ncbi:MAG: bifunctional pyr operon transcriptional regulator/uracil phosphoribosyltransferase PyrR [Actinomycetota bacterium]|nr:bifunctional pyr operon transcriptional regulator/uracil phosphoribosyltransferase PyrR [Actinomycetota bacterium]
MNDIEKKLIMDAEAIERSLKRIAHEIVEKNRGAKEIALVGIRKRGVHLAKRLAKKIESIEGGAVLYGTLDVTFYRDDVAANLSLSKANKTEIAFDASNINIILVDDVLYTGRTVRSAMDAIMDFGRPTSIQLVILVDRGHRELPIKADFVGKNIPTSRRERVWVNLLEEDGVDSVEIRGEGHPEEEVEK